MSRILMAGESPTIEAEGFVVEDGVPGNVTRQSGLGSTPQGNRSEWSHRILEDPSQFPTFATVRIFGTPAGGASAPVNEHWGRMRVFGNGFNRDEDIRVWGLRLGPARNSVPMLNIVEDDLGTANRAAIRVRNSTGGQIANSGANHINKDEVQLWEWHVVFDPVNGLVEIWLDDVLRISYSGPLVGPSGETTFDTLALGGGTPPGGQDPGVVVDTAQRSRWTYDDIAINDTAGSLNTGRIGDGFLIRLIPNGNGAFSQLRNANGNSVNNYLHVAGQAEGFVSAFANGERDSYVLQRLDPEWGGVNALRLDAAVGSNGPLLNNLRFSAKPVGQADFQAATADPIPSDAVPDQLAHSPNVSRIIEENPNTTAGFTITELDGAEAGFAFET